MSQGRGCRSEKVLVQPNMRIFLQCSVQGLGRLKLRVLVPIVFHFLHYSQESLRHVCLLQFSLISAKPLHFYISLSQSSNRPGNQFPLGNYHHISFIQAIKSCILTMLIQKICHKGLLHLGKDHYLFIGGVTIFGTCRQFFSEE